MEEDHKSELSLNYLLNPVCFSLLLLLIFLKGDE